MIALYINYVTISLLSHILQSEYATKNILKAWADRALLVCYQLLFINNFFLLFLWIGRD